MRESLNIQMHTCGNATLIITKDNKPVIATDPWLHSHTAYFGSWATTHEISKFHMELLQNCPFYWISHFHPDHLNLRSLLKLKAREKTILISYQYSNRVAQELRNAGMKVIIMPPRKYINIQDEIDIATFPILDTVDSALLIKCRGNLIINLNDTFCDPSISFLKKEISKSRNSLLLKLAGYGDADMINIFDYENNFIKPLASSKPAPGEILTLQAKKINCTHAMHFSSFHKYVRADSLWANKYITPEEDLERGWDKRIGYFKQFSSLSITSEGFKKIESIYPSKNDIKISSPEKYGDKWDQEPSLKDINLIKKYLNQINLVGKKSFNIKVGNCIIRPEIENSLTNFVIHAPRNSVVRAIRSNIFDDLLIGNFAKLILPKRKSINYKKTLRVASKFIDNLGIKDANETKKFLWIYRNSYDNKYVAIQSIFKNKARDLITTKLNGRANLLGKLKLIYQSF